MLLLYCVVAVHSGDLFEFSLSDDCVIYLAPSDLNYFIII
jgi:hypothetical protein